MVKDLKIVVGQLAQLQPRTPPTSVKTAMMRFTIDNLNAIGMASEAIDGASQCLAALSVATATSRSSSFSFPEDEWRKSEGATAREDPHNEIKETGVSQIDISNARAWQLAIILSN